MKEFIIANFKEIIVVFLLSLEFILQLILLFVKSKKKYPAIALVLNRLPTIINSVEGKSFSSSEKKKIVLDIALSLFKRESGVDAPKSCVFLIDEAIEDILSTPQKKGERSDA